MAIIPDQIGQNIVIDTPQKQKTRKLVMLLIGVAIATAVIIYFGFFSGSNNSSPTDQGASGADMAGGSIEQIDQSNAILESLRDITLNNPVFMDKNFKSLITSDRLPVVIGTKGRENPFASF